MRKNRLLRLLAIAALFVLPFLEVAGQSSNAQTMASGWYGEYFNNPYLSGGPVFARNEMDINFDWGFGSPGSGVPADNFSVRWTRVLYLPAGSYRFFVTVDDGVRLFVDGQLLIDRWLVTAPTTYNASALLGTGNHDFRIEYFEAGERAQVRFWWEQGGGSQPPPPGNTSGWRGEYYDNRSLAGGPRFVRYDANLNFEWYNDSPQPGFPGDNFSVRWTRDVHFDGGRYDFVVMADDGVRVFLDGNAIIDSWTETANKERRATVNIRGGSHNVRVEYFEAGGSAIMQLRWQRADIRLVGNLLTCMRPQNAWIKVYRLSPSGTWEDLNPQGWGPLDATGRRKIDGLPVDSFYGSEGQPYRVEHWASGSLVNQVGNTSAGQPVWRLLPESDNYTPWPCG